jgi:thymidylate synthase (FAD)
MQVQLANNTPNPEGFIAYIARVSNPTNQHNPDYAKLIKYLLVNKHYSPFEHASFTFQITTSRAIAAQILRHRSFSFQEFSQRYSVAENIEAIELRKQAKKNRQSSEEGFDPLLYNRQYDYSGKYASEVIEDHISRTYSLYNTLIEAGVAKESARFVLPLATTTTLYMSGTIRSWITYLMVRNDEHTQIEHRQIAQEIEKILRQHLPTVFAALDDIKQDEEKDRLLLSLLKTHKISDVELLQRLLAIA